MAYYTFVSDICREEADRHSQIEGVEKLARQIEKTQTIDNLDSFPGSFVKKDFGKSFRLIIGKVYDHEDCLLIFWHFWPKSSDEYSEFEKKSRDYRQQFENKFPPTMLADIWIWKRQSPAVTPASPLTDTEREFLFKPLVLSQTDEDWIVLESPDWLARIRAQGGQGQRGMDFTPYLSQLHQMVLDSLHKDDEYIINGTIGVLYHRLESHKILFLIAPFDSKDATGIEHLKGKYQKLTGASLEQSGQNVNDLRRIARRAYPALILADQALWINEIQKQDEKANLALSPEETALLQQKGGFYPLFINGRPGSGKSTVLQYLFAQYLFEYSQQPDAIALPVYLTYSRELLDTARKTVVQLLSSNALLIQDTNRMDAGQAQRLADQTFHVFRDYLLKLLPESGRFQSEKHIHYPYFRRLYEDKYHGAKLHNMAEIAWHVIRTYIKGCAAEGDEFMSPDVYREFPKKQRSVTQEIFEKVYEQVWEAWYLPLTQQQGYWDDQDLARAVLQTMAEEGLPDGSGRHSVVFCDEAQDFTRNELRLILRLSAFSRRKLTPDILDRIPFAFAGDPFQTLNPTGFDWKRAKENLYRVIRDQLDHSENPKLEFNYQELAFNYRSANSIVQVGNFIHLLRGVAFRREDLTPQNAWFDAPSAEPVYYDSADRLVRTYLPKQGTDVLIVPCHEGEELEYVQKDPFLETFALSDDKQTLSRNVLSPMRAKGQEFDRVVLYGFGEACVGDPQYQKLIDLIDLIDPDVAKPELNEDELIPLEYFINRLYVAASRAKKRLIIVDSKRGLEEFWRFFYDSEPENFVRRYQTISQNSASQWDASRHLIRIQPGTASEWEKDLNDPLELANGFKEKGKLSEDAYLLERAARNFRLAQREAEAVECEALACEFKGQFAQAGEKYQSLRMSEKAEACYWKARAYDKICSLNTNSLRNKAARLMQTLQANQNSDLASVLDLHSKVAAPQTGDFRLDDVWSEVLASIYKYLAEKVAETALKHYEWCNLHDAARDLLQRQVLSHSAETQRQINTLRVRSTPYPQRLEVLKELDAQPAQIVECYQAASDVPLNNSQVDIVLWALKQLRNYTAAEVDFGDGQAIAVSLLKRLRKYTDPEVLLSRCSYLEGYADLLETYLQEGLSTHLDDVLMGAFTFLIRQQDWDRVFDVVSTGRPLLAENSVAQLKKSRGSYVLDVALIKVLSVSDELAKADRSTQSKVSEYLKERLLDKHEDFHSLLTIAQAGAALERTNRIIDSLKFYEMVWRERTWPACDEDILLARQRWLVCKQRQKDILAKSAEDKARIEKEIRGRQAKWGIDDLSLLPEYPVVDLKAQPRLPQRTLKQVSQSESALGSSSRVKTSDVANDDLLLKASVPTRQPLTPEGQQPSNESEPDEPERATEEESEITEPADTGMAGPISIQITVSAQTFTVEISRQRDKMTVRKSGEVEMSTVIAKGLKLQGSDDEFHAQIEKRAWRRDIVRYFIRPWNLTCVLRHRDGRVSVSLYLGDREVELCSVRLSL